MKQFPSRQKFKKYHKPSLNSYKSNTSKMFMPLIGQYALKALSAGKLNFKQLESGRRAIRRTTKKRGQIKIQVFTYASITKKPVASRMGKGKGNHSIWISPIKAGQNIYELSGVSFTTSLKAMRLAGDKMPFPTKVVRLTY